MPSKSRLSRPPELIAARLQRLRTQIAHKRLDAFLVTNRVDQYYLTGFDGEDGAVLVLPRQVVLITDGRFVEEAATVAPWAKAVLRAGAFSAAVGKTVRRHRLGRVGVDPDYVSMAQHAALRKACDSTRFVAVPKLVETLRVIKDADEVVAIERAIEVAQDAFVAVRRRLRMGMTESQIAAELLYQMQRRGASDASFPTIVAEGPASSLPHAKAGNRKIGPGSVVLIDWGATVNHYRSDLTRVLFIRRIAPRFRRMYEHVLAAQAAGIAAIRPGAAFADVDAQARRVLKHHGMDRAFSHSLGHGIGLDIHEAPRLSRVAEGELQAGMVVTAEPGVYFPGVGGVRIEDDVLVTSDGCRVLSDLPKALDDCVV